MQTDWLFTHAHLMTMEGSGVGYLADGAVAVRGNRITAVGTTADVTAEALRHGPPCHTVDVRDHVILPGFVDAHIHTQLGLLRGIAQDMHHWMLQGVLPYLAEIKPRWQVLATQLSVLEAVRSGTTTFGDFLMFPGPDVFAFYLDSGIRVRPILPIFEMAPGFLGKGELYHLDAQMGRATFNEACRLFSEFHGADAGRIQCMFGPFATDFVSREVLVRVKEAAAVRGVPIQMHTAQGSRETRQMELRYGRRSIPFLAEHQYFDRQFTAVHMTEALPDEVHLVAEAGSHLVVCNGSIGLVDGLIPPAEAFQQAGGCVGLGSDQAAGNNSCNIFNEMKLTALFGKLARRDPTAMPAERVLRMATIDGARTLGLELEVGSLTPGKKADLVFVDLRRPTLQPIILEPLNLPANLVYAARGDEVDRVMIDGRMIFEQGQFRTINEAAVLAEIRDTVPRRRRKASL